MKKSRIKNIKNKIESKLFKAKVLIMDELKNDDGIGVVEVILILLVIVGLIVIFKSQLTSIAKSVFGNITKQVKTL